MTRLRGLYRAMPITATLAMVAAASMAGVPLLNGFISKEMFFAETTFISGDLITRVGLPIAATLAGAFSVAYSLRFIARVFFGPPATDLPRAPHEPPRFMLVPSGLLVFICLIVGILPAYTLGPLLTVAARSILGDGNLPEYSLSLWHGFNLPLAMSFLAMALGVLIHYSLRHWQRTRPGRAPFIYRLDGRRSFEFILDSLTAGSTWLLSWVSTYRLQVQLLSIVLVAFLSAWLPLRAGGWSGAWANTSAIDPAFALLWTIGGACAVGVAFQAKFHRLAALTLAGAAGLITCLTFAWFSAPDLALTQLAVEVVTVVLILLGLRWLPRRIEGDEADVDLKARGRRVRDVVVSIAAGGGLAAMAYAVMTRPAGEGISSFFVENALELGGGTNVVNVLLVDFRGFDTLGEITVLGIVGLTVYALLRRFRPPPESVDRPVQQRQQDDDGDTPPRLEPLADREEAARKVIDAELPVGQMMVPAVLVRLLLPVAALVSVFFLVRGHNLPGGGFVGGLIMATAVILQYMVGGVIWVESRTRIHPQAWIAFGLLAAGSAALMSWVMGKPFLTAMAWDVALPLIGHIHLSTVLLFDIGVYMLVIGAAVLILVALAHQSLRMQRKAAAAAIAHAAVTPGEA